MSVATPRGSSVTPTPIASFTIGTTWELIRENFQTFAPHVDAEAIKTRASATEVSSLWLFRIINLNRGKCDWCCEWLDDLRHEHHILHDSPCSCALQETDNWTTSAMNGPGYIAYGRDHSRTAINHFRRSWVDTERRRSAILVGSTVLLSVLCRSVAAMRRTTSRLWRR